MVVVAIITAGMNDQRSAGQHGRIADFGGQTGRAGKNLDAMWRAGGDGNVAGHVIRRRCVIGGNDSDAGTIRLQRRANANVGRERADAIADTPIHRIVVEIIAGSIKTRSMNRQRLIGG